MNIFLETEQKTITKKNFEGTVLELLKELKINPETVIVVSSNELQNENDILKEGDDIKILSVVSGG